jgi:hypothetical protein
MLQLRSTMRVRVCVFSVIFSGNPRREICPRARRIQYITTLYGQQVWTLVWRRGGLSFLGTSYIIEGRTEGVLLGSRLSVWLRAAQTAAKKTKEKPRRALNISTENAKSCSRRKLQLKVSCVTSLLYHCLGCDGTRARSQKSGEIWMMNICRNYVLKIYIHRL